MPSNVTSAEPVRKSVTVPADPQRAFQLFTAHMHEWWPLATHSVGAGDAVSVTFGEEAGAAIVETVADGTTSVWGTVTHWEPPCRVAFTWHPGSSETEATRVEVTFTQSGPGRTVVSLVHSGRERRPDGASARESYDSGWDPVVGCFAEAAARLPRLTSPGAPGCRARLGAP
jgi:uncharacterized protein YndB with AHSA1/START domain